MSAITGADRRHLRGLAHSLKPVVRVGGAGLTAPVVAAVDTALDDRKSLAEDIARRTGAELAGLIGQVAILYRPAADAERRAIVLPSADRAT